LRDDMTWTNQRITSTITITPTIPTPPPLELAAASRRVPSWFRERPTPPVNPSVLAEPHEVMKVRHFRRVSSTGPDMNPR